MIFINNDLLWLCLHMKLFNLPFKENMMWQNFDEGCKYMKFYKKSLGPIWLGCFRGIGNGQGKMGGILNGWGVWLGHNFGEV